MKKKKVMPANAIEFGGYPEQESMQFGFFSKITVLNIISSLY